MAQNLNQLIRLVLGTLSVCLMAGCSLHGHEPRLRFALNQKPVSEEAMPNFQSGFAPSGYAPESRAAKLREDLLSPSSGDAPGEKDWRFVRGADKGPTILGLGLKFDLSEGGWTFRTGVMRRGSQSAFTPQFVVSFDKL